MRDMDKKENPSPTSSMSVEEMKELASQLRNPSGAKGIEVADMMNHTNISMTLNTIDELDIRDAQKILELGHGNGHHIGHLFSKANGATYFGLDISELMMHEAIAYCKKSGFDKQTYFQQYDGRKIPYSHNHFDCIFTVNTIY